MNKTNFQTYKFRASGLKNLMVKSRSKKDPLSQTTKSYLQQVWIEAVYSRRKPIITPAMSKGTIVESDSLDLVQQVHGEKYFKNIKSLENDFITGTPDVIDKPNDLIIDIKSPWDIWSFARVDEKVASKDYYYQILAYMWLTGCKKGSLIYALVSAPEILINDELYKMSFKMPEEEALKLRINYEYDDIDPKVRLRRFDFEFSQDDIDKLKEKIEICREYLQEFSL